MRPIDRLENTIKDLITYISGLAPERLELSRAKQWGPREVFIHIVFWHEQYVSITKALLARDRPRLLTGTFKQHNALAVERNKDVPVEVLIERLQQAQAELLPSYEAAKNLRIAFKEGGKVRSYPEAIERIEQHIRSHLERLKSCRPHD